jgi:hypothetical protein
MISPDSSGVPIAAGSRARRIALAVGLAAVVGAGLYGAGWAYMAGRFADGVRAFIAARQAEGAAVAYAGVALGGFPLRLEARVLAPSATIALKDGTWIWRPERAIFSARPWSVGRVTLDLSGAHTIAPADASGLARWTATAGAFAIEARISAADVAALALRARELRIRDRAGEDILALDRLRVDWRAAAAVPGDSRPEHARPSQYFESVVETIRPPPGARLPLGDDIARLVLAGEVRGRLAPATGAGALGRWRDVFGRWRDGGGTVELSRVEGRWGALTLAGEGTLALDGAFQPVGAFTARIEGYSETLDALRAAGALDGGAALAAKMTLTALARRDGELTGSGRPYLTLPVAIQDRRLYVGPVPLLTVPAVSW